MAKARRQKGDEQKPDGSAGGGGGGGGVTVKHQKLCLSIDMEKRLIYGYTEIEVDLAENDTLALHADNMAIRNVLVDGETTEFEYFPSWKNIGDQQIWSSVSCSKTAADAACSTYISSLNSETVPNLIISCERSVKLITGQQHEENGGKIGQNGDDQAVNGCNGSSEEKQKNKRLVHIDYMLEKAETGIHFMGNILHSSNQIRRAHCWFPCINTASHRCPFDLEFTVGTDLVAVSNGDLLYQVLSKEDPPRKTYVYQLKASVSAQWISLVVGPFEILPDSHYTSISHMCLSLSLSKLENTIGFFHNAYSYYEQYLSTSFPFGSYKQIFLPSEMTVSSTSLGASTCIFSSDILYDAKVIDQTIDTRIKLAYALARQWFGIYTSAEEPTDEWLLDGLAGFLTDNFIKCFLGNNEARYRRFKANCTVCEMDVSGATALNSSAASGDLYGTQTIGEYGKYRSWKAVAVLQMLEKQMGPDSFQKILHTIVHPNRFSRTLSTKEFRHLANKVGNLERPFLKEFFPRWVESCGCPVMRLGVSYSKRRNIIELAVSRGCTAKGDPTSSDSHHDGDIREGDVGWPGMMSIRVHELDGEYDHPILPMAGEALQVVEIQCHSKLAAKRFQKSKKGSKPDGSDDNTDAPTQDIRMGMDSPLLWIRADPEMEYLAEVHFHQPVQMWINQLEKDKDVIAQSQAIAILEKVPQLSFSVINALNNFLNDTKAFWKVRIEAAYALAVTASEDTDLAGLLHLLKFYKSRRFDADIGLPRPNDFRDVPEYFVLEAIPHAVALVRASDKSSPREAVEFILQLLKYNDNNGNAYSDVYWLSAMVQAIGELEFGQQGSGLLSSLLKRIDRLLQFDSFMPSYNGVLTISCIRTLARIAEKVSSSVCLDRICELIAPFRSTYKPFKVRIEASRVLIDLEFHYKGLDAAISLFLKYLDEEESLRGETKLAVYVLHLCRTNVGSHLDNQISCPTLVGLLCLLASKKAYNNVFLRHYLFCILQIAAGRPPTLYGVPKTVVPPTRVQEICSDQQTKVDSPMPQISRPQEPSTSTPSVREVLPISGPTKEADNISTCSERRNVLKIKVKHTASSSKADDADRQRDRPHGGRNENEMGPCSSMSVDAPIVGAANEQLNISNQNFEELNSCHDRESRMSASFSSAKLTDKYEASKELQCTADSRLSALSKDQVSPANDMQDAIDKTQGHSTSDDGNQAQESMNGLEEKERRKKDKKEKDKKRKRDKKDDPEYLERKRLKKEKKRMEKELAKKQKGVEGAPAAELQNLVKPADSQGNLLARPPAPIRIVGHQVSPADSQGNLLSRPLAPVRNVEPQVSNRETTEDTARTSSASKLRIKIKTRSVSNI